MTPKSQGVVTATVFMTTDGQKFDDIKGAERHQLGLNRRKAIRDRVKTLVPNRPGSVDYIDQLTTFLYCHIEEMQGLIDDMRAAGLLNSHERTADRLTSQATDIELLKA